MHYFSTSLKSTLQFQSGLYFKPTLQLKSTLHISHQVRTKKKRKVQLPGTDDSFLTTVQSIQDSINKSRLEKDEHYHFAIQLVPILRDLPKHSAMQVKAKIMCLLADVVKDQEKISQQDAEHGAVLSFDGSGALYQQLV